MMKTWVAKLQTVPLWVWYVIIAVGIVVLYVPTRDSMIVQDAWIQIVKSKLTLTYLTALFLFGTLADKGKLSKNKKKNTLYWILGTGAIVAIGMFSP